MRAACIGCSIWAPARAASPSPVPGPCRVPASTRSTSPMPLWRWRAATCAVIGSRAVSGSGSPITSARSGAQPTISSSPIRLTWARASLRGCRRSTGTSRAWRSRPAAPGSTPYGLSCARRAGICGRAGCSSSRWATPRARCDGHSAVCPSCGLNSSAVGAGCSCSRASNCRRAEDAQQRPRAQRTTMSGNTIGRLFTVTTFGESHGPAMGCIVDGCPPGLELSEADLQQDVDRRRSGTSHFVSQRREADQVRILSGVFEGRTTGTPIGILIDNTDARSRDYDKIKDRFRPGHADYTYQQKYGVRDYRGGGRSSARETVMRTAAGAIARRYLAVRLGVRIYGYLSQVGSLMLEAVDPAFAYQNPFFCPDPGRIAELEELIWKVRGAGDSIGARVTVVASGVPPGLGEPVFDRLDADIAHALMSINAVKAVEIGAGTRAATQRGSEHRDELTPAGFRSNHAGGVLGGISSGQDVIAHLTLKPTSSIQVPGSTIDTDGNAVDIVTTGRHDPCVGLRATPIAEAMLAIVLMDHYLRQRAQNADVKSSTPDITAAPRG